MRQAAVAAAALLLALSIALAWRAVLAVAGMGALGYSRNRWGGLASRRSVWRESFGVPYPQLLAALEGE